MFKERIRLPLVFLVSPKTFFTYILKEIILILLIHCKLYAAAVISLQFIKKNQIYQFLFCGYHLVHILEIVWDTSTSISNPAIFLHTVLDLLNKADLILATQSKLVFEFSSLKLTAEGLSFPISVVPDVSKAFHTLFPHCLLLKTPEVQMAMVI